MNPFTVIQRYADQIGGTFTNYDNEKAVIIVPLKDGRFQTVLSVISNSKVSGKGRLYFTSKVCDFGPHVNASELLQQNGNFDYSKFIVDDGLLKVEASCLAEASSEEEIKYMIQEVAQLADQYEKRLTGKDIY